MLGAGELERVDLNAMAGADTPAEKLLGLMLMTAVGARAAEIHISVIGEEFSARYRHQNRWVAVDPLHPELHLSILSTLKRLARLDPESSNFSQEGHLLMELDMRPIDAWISCVPNSLGEHVEIHIY